MVGERERRPALKSSVEGTILRIETTKTHEDGRRFQNCIVDIPEETRRSLPDEFKDFKLELERTNHVLLSGLHWEFEGLQEGDRVVISISGYHNEYPLPYYRVEKKEE